MRLLPLIAALAVSFSAFAAEPAQTGHPVLSGEAAAATLDTFTNTETGVVAVLSKHYLSLAVAGAGPNAIRQKHDAAYVAPAEMAFFRVGARSAFLLDSARITASIYQQEHTFWRRLMSFFHDSKQQDVNQSFTNQNRVKTCNAQLVAANKKYQAHYAAFKKAYPTSPFVESFADLGPALKTVADAASKKPTEFPIQPDEATIYKLKYPFDKAFNTGLSNIPETTKRAGEAERLIMYFGLTSFEKDHGVSHEIMYKEDTRDLTLDPAGACLPPKFTILQRAAYGPEFSRRRDEIGDYLRKTGELKN